eukprot:404048-Prorocentrum_minimum.AAC.2
MRYSRKPTTRADNSCRVEAEGRAVFCLNELRLPPAKSLIAVIIPDRSQYLHTIYEPKCVGWG